MGIDAKAYKELWEILKLIPQDEYNKISSKFIEIIKSNMDNNYTYKIEHIEDFENQEMMEETRILLAILYRDYWASPEEKDEIIRNEKEELIRNDELLRKKYNPDDLFKNSQTNIKTNNSETAESTDMIVFQKEKWYIKVIDFIKGLFRR